MEYSKPSLLFYALQILQSQPATSCFPIQPVSDENKRHAFAGTAGSHHEAFTYFILSMWMLPQRDLQPTGCGNQLKPYKQWPEYSDSLGYLSQISL